MGQDESVGVRTCLLQELCRLSELLIAVRGAQEQLYFLLLVVVLRDCKSMLIVQWLSL